MLSNSEATVTVKSVVEGLLEICTTLNIPTAPSYTKRDVDQGVEYQGIEIQNEDGDELCVLTIVHDKCYSEPPMEVVCELNDNELFIEQLPERPTFLHLAKIIITAIDAANAFLGESEESGEYEESYIDFDFES